MVQNLHAIQKSFPWATTMKTIHQFLPALALGLSMASVHAAPVPTSIPNTATCTLDSVAITGMTSSKTGAQVLPANTTVNSTKCFGVISGNDATNGTNSPSPNLGYLGDGLLNGGYMKDGYYVDPGFFLVDGSTYQPLKDPNLAVDPGWIMLGKMEGGSGTMDGYKVTNGANVLDIDDVLTFTMNANGTWSLQTKADIVDILDAAGMFDRSYFDQLAFVFKAGSGAQDKDGGWAIYDINFNTLLKQMPGAFDLKQPYSFTGTWNTDDFGGKEISHMSLWARDPLNTTSNVPLPGSVLLMGIGLLALGFVRRKAH